MQREYKEYRKLICKSIGELVKDIRLEKHKSLTLLSNEAGLSKSIWADLEKGDKDPQITTLWRIAEALDVPLSEVIKTVENSLPKDWSFIDN